MPQRNNEWRKMLMSMRRKEQLSREAGFTPVLKGSKPLLSQSRQHYRTTMEAIKND